jgi:homoserine kinase type II
MAVYTEVADQDLARFVASYGLGKLLSYKGIAEGVENTNYIVHTERGSFILTLYEKRVDPKDLPFFLGLMDHLASNGLNCPVPVRDPDGRMLGEIAGRPAAMVTFLEGVWPRKPNVSNCEAVGTALAQLHLASRGFEIHRKNGLGLTDWRPLFNQFASKADAITPSLHQTIAAELDHLESHWPRDLPHGVIHADLFQDNVFFLGDKLSGVIDFYFACNDALAYDVAVCLNAWCFEPDHTFNPAKGAALLKGYQVIRPLEQRELANLPLLARGAALRFLLTRGYDWINTPPGALVQRKDPLEYLAKLRVHQRMASARDYGAAA